MPFVVRLSENASKITVEPIYDQIKTNRRIDRFMREAEPPRSRSGG